MASITDLYRLLFGREGTAKGSDIDMSEHGRVGGVSTGVPFKNVAVIDPVTGEYPTSGILTQLETMNSLIPNKYDSLIITYTDSTKKTIDNVVFKLDGTTVQTITLAQATLTDTWARS